jgi:hypothetical protein
MGAVLLDVANFMASEAYLARGSRDGGVDGGIGAGLAGIGSSGEDVVAAALVVIGEAGENVTCGGTV